MDKDCTHFEGQVEHRDVHNLYGHYVAAATFAGQLQRRDGTDRPFVLSRAFFAGTQRYAAVWTGDNAADWEHLGYSLPMLLSLGVAGLPFVGADVGGFFGDVEPELLVRWYQAAVFQPFFRAHAHIDSARREPWLFDEDTMLLLRNAVRLRYSFLPHLYSVFWEASTTAAPVMRPLWLHFAHDDNVLSMDDQFLLGDSLLVKPVTQKSTVSSTVYFPANTTWFDIESYQLYSGGQHVSVASPLSKLPAFQRGGSIVTKQERIRRSSSLMQNDPITLVVALDTNSSASGLLYLDDGHSYEFQSGAFNLRNLSFDGASLQLSSTSLSSGTYSCPNVVERIVILGLDRTISRVLSRTPGLDDLSFLQNEQSLVIRKPNVPICSDFTLWLE